MQIPCLCCATILLALMGSPRPAQADDRRDAARQLADQGYALYQAGNYERAIDSLTRAEALFHAPTVMLILARAHAKIGKLVEARALLQRVASEPHARGAPREYVEAQATAVAELEELGRRIPKLVVTVLNAPRRGLRVTVNGIALSAEELGRSREVNPGSHTITVSAPGIPHRMVSQVAAEGRTESIHFSLPMLADPDAAIAPAPPDTRGSTIPGFVVLGAGVVGLGVAAVTGVIALGKEGELDERCPDNRCRPEDEPLASSAQDFAIVSTISFVVAGAAAGAGIVLLVLRPGGAAAAPSAPPAALRARLGLGFAGVEGTF